MPSPADRTQVRLALVLNGGVSLAVWMGGVVHELDVARRASLDIDPPADEPDPDIYRAWREVFRKARLTLSVDVIAGTSAGGLNGSFLAEAIANGHRLPDLRTVWLETASLEANTLLRHEDRGSVLSGDFFKEEIDKHLVDMPARVDPPAAENPAPAEPDKGEPVTLLVTATGLSGGTREVRDAFDSPFSTQDHRRLYRFAKQPANWTYTELGGFASTPAENDFTASDREALATAARASASFPAAFAPVDESVLLAYREGTTATDAGTSGLLDGGVLDNAPFGPLLEEVARRPASGPYRRVVAYVVPSTGPLTEAAAALPVADTPLGKILGSTLQMPREADFRDDVEELAAFSRYSELDSRPRLIHQQLADPATLQRLSVAAPALLPEYRCSALLTALIQSRVSLSALASLRLASLRADLPEGLENRPWLPADLTAWRWTPEAALRALRPLQHDVRLWLLGLQDPVAVDAAAAVRDPLADAQSSLDLASRQVRALGEAVSAYICSQNASPRLPPRALVPLLDSAHEAMNSTEQLSTLMDRAFAAYAAAMLPGGDATQRATQASLVRQACMQAEVVAQVGEAGGGKVFPPFELLRIGPDVRSPLVTSDAIMALGGRKLYGTTLGHFGGFLNRSWRQWDFMWGRLDATAQILRLVSFDGSPQEQQQQRTAAVLAHQKLILTASQTTVEQLAPTLTRLGDPKDGGVVATELKTVSGRAVVRDALQAVLQVFLRPYSTTVRPARWKRLLWVGATGAKPAGLLEKVVWQLTRRLRTVASGSFGTPEKLPGQVFRAAVVPTLVVLASVLFIAGLIVGWLVT